MKNKYLSILKEKRILSPIVVGVVFVLALLIDLLTKGLIIQNLIPKVGDSMKIIPKVVSFIFVKNYGAAWGIFQNSTIFLSIVTFLGIAIILAFYIVRLRMVGNKTSILFAVSIGMILGGAFGNLIDRLALGYVRDFINFDFINFPVFNFADTFLTIGIILLIIYMLFLYSKETENKYGKQKSDKNLMNHNDIDKLDCVIEDKEKENNIDFLKNDDILNDDGSIKNEKDFKDEESLFDDKNGGVNNE